MKDNKYYWINRASKHHIDKLRTLMSDLPDGDEILSSGNPRYIRYFVDEEESDDGHRLYQFLIEYDIYNPSQGIYFGCKSVTREGHCHKTEVKKALSDWLALRYMVTLRLNNIFPGVDFTYRYKDTDNVADHTFWPFWIELYESDSLTDFAIPALRKIADVYRDKSAMLRVYDNKDAEKEIPYPPVITAFTHQAFIDFKISILSNVKKRAISSTGESAAEEAWAQIKKFIAAGESNGVFIRSHHYDYAWLVNCADIEFKALVTSFFAYLSRRLNVDGIKIPWSNIIRVFMRSDETSYKIQVKTINPKIDTINKIECLLQCMLND